MGSVEERRLREGWLRVPTCASMTPEDAAGHLRAMGFAGDIRTERLSPGVLGCPPGRVTLVSPDPSSPRVVRPETPLVVYVNAGETQPLTEAEERDMRRAAEEAEEAAAEQASWAAEQMKVGRPPNIVEPRPPATVVLDDALVERTVERLRSAGADLADRLRPGLSDAQIDELAGPAGIDLPEEARVWWRWHDGVQDDGPPFASIRGVTPYSLEAAIELWEADRDATRYVFGVDGLLPFCDARLSFECLGPRDAPVPVYFQYDIETPKPMFASIGDFVVKFLEGD